MQGQVIWFLAVAVVVLIVMPYAIAFRRRTRHDRSRKAEAVALGIDKPKAQYPYIDPVRCIGCGACVDACPEGDVLGIVDGVATVINGIRCVGHAECQAACPVDGIEVGLGDVKSRTDMPLLDESYESSVPGVYIAGELGGLALIRYAVAQGRDAAAAIADQITIRSDRPGNGAGPETTHDLIIVGAGPAGLSAALEAKRRGLDALILDQEQDLGGTILHYPRRKLVLTKPIELPLWGAMDRDEYPKEELLEIFQDCVDRFELPVRFSQKVQDVQRDNGCAVVRTASSEFRARSVVLATGRRGSPRKLGVPGEELSKVAYRLIDADGYREQRILIVGGGDSAIEAAIGLSHKGHNEVWLSYRKPRLLRVKRKNQDAAERAIAAGWIQPLFNSNVTAIHEDRVSLQVEQEQVEIPNDYVFVFIGGEPPFPLLERIGILFGGPATGEQS